MQTRYSDRDPEIRYFRELLEKLTKQTRHPYKTLKPSMLPVEAGIYMIAAGWEIIRAGKTTSLRQRLYQNHLMGNQSGNLPAQLVNSGHCTDLLAAKKWIRDECEFHYLVIEDEKERSRAEHFMLGVINPRYCDKNKLIAARSA